jgi:hypothetical protein
MLARLGETAKIVFRFTHTCFMLRDNFSAASLGRTLNPPSHAHGFFAEVAHAF